MPRTAMPKKSAPEPIKTTSDKFPRRCPALWDAAVTRTFESGGIVRATCPACGWTERYRVVDRV